MKGIIERLLIVLFSVIVLGASAQDRIKIWPDWSMKDAEKILNDSPWGQTQVQADAQQMFPNLAVSNMDILYGAAAPRMDDRYQRTPPPDLTNSVDYYIRFLSAKPIRQAYARITELQQPNANPQLLQGLRDFVASKFSQEIVVAVAFESKNNPRFTGPVMLLFKGATLSTLKHDTYLDLDNGKRIFLEDYKAPGSDGLGAKFIFPRTVNGVPVITAQSGEVLFFAKLTSKNASKPLIINMRFKVGNFKYEGSLEY
jgi:hypothetical protein